MNPNLALVVSGVSMVPELTAGALEVEAELLPELLQPWASTVPAAVAPNVTINFRLEKLTMRPIVRLSKSVIG